MSTEDLRRIGRISLPFPLQKISTEIFPEVRRSWLETYDEGKRTGAEIGQLVESVEWECV